MLIRLVHDIQVGQRKQLWIGERSRKVEFCIILNKINFCQSYLIHTRKGKILYNVVFIEIICKQNCSTVAAFLKKFTEIIKVISFSDGGWYVAWSTQLHFLKSSSVKRH